MEVTIGLALIAGLVSFISPCVLPLVPASIGYMGGRMTNTVALSLAGGGTTARTLAHRLTIILHGAAFVAGFTFVFVSIGLLSTAFVNVIGGANIITVTNMIGRIGGLVIIFFGLHFMGVMPALFARLLRRQDILGSPLFTLLIAILGSIAIAWGFTGQIAIWSPEVWEFTPWAPALALVALTSFGLWLIMGGAFTQPHPFWTRTLSMVQRGIYADTRRQMTAPGHTGYSSSAIMGVIFAAGWTPCIGPVYGAVLTMAMAEGGANAGQAAVLLTAYSLGLGVPFMLTAVMLEGAQNLLRGLQRHMRRIELVSGAFLILIGVLVASGTLQRLSTQFSGQFAEFSIGVEEAVLDLVTGGGNDEAAEPASIIPEAEGDAGASSNLIITGPPAADTTDIVAIGSLTDLAAAGGDAPVIGLNIGDIAPGFEAITDTGRPIRLADLRGDVVLLNFWATWCGPCRIEMPVFEEVYQQRRDEGFTVLAVNNREPLPIVQAFRQEMNGLTFPMAIDETAAIQRQFNILSYPSTFLLDRDGVIVARHFGPLTAQQIDEMIAAALNG